MEDKTLITREWLKRNGWVCVHNDTWTKSINGIWYNLIYTDFDYDYILTKEIGAVDSAEKLNELIK